MNGLAPVESAGGQLRELALFAGAGGGLLASHLLGWRTDEKSVWGKNRP